MFQDKVIWITGASSGIGAETAKQLNALGAYVVLSARNTSALKSVADELACAERSLVLPLDLTQPDTFQSLVSEVVRSFGKIDCLFNNGGVSQRSWASETPVELDRQLMEINYFGTVALTKAVLPVMQRQQSGHIVVISSIVGKFGFYLRSAYAASKHALQGFFETLSLEEAKNNISVTIAYPGKINTPISQSALTASGESHGRADHNQARGMPVEQCVSQLIKAVRKRKKSVLIGRREVYAVHIKRFFPALFWRIIRRQSPV